MKKKLVLIILGLAAVPASYGQGGITFNNGPNGGPYNPIIWDPSVPTVGGQGVRSTQGAIISVWFGEGVLAANALAQGPDIVWNSGFESGGFYGYYTATATLPTWQSGDTFTFQLRATGPGGINGSSVLWTENANIANIGGTPPGPAGTSVNSIGFNVLVPEPSTFAMIGVGALALLNFRRRS